MLKRGRSSERERERERWKNIPYIFNPVLRFLASLFFYQFLLHGSKACGSGYSMGCGFEMVERLYE
jgi:hypothetical protein